MIIRKPYAFLIKNFRKIHILLLILSIYVAYKVIGVSSFVNEFMTYTSYDLINNPITNKINFLLKISVLILIIGSASIMFLLMHKKKPWKLYLIPVVEYLLLFFILNMITSFFRKISYDVKVTDLRFARDLLLIFTIVQIASIGLFIVRVFGLDVRKFNFNIDQEFLELSDADREEVEIGLSFDKNTFFRWFRRLKRNIGYFYVEHKLICKGVLSILGIILLFSGYKYFFVTTKSYKQGDAYNVDGFTFKVNKAYFTDKDYAGNKIEKNSNFIIVDLTITNNASSRVVNLDYFHLKTGAYDYITTRKKYETQFKDLGVAYSENKELKKGESLNCIIIYKISNKHNKSSFSLFYQEKTGYLRKIKLKVTDISKIKEMDILKLGDEVDIPIYKSEDVITFESHAFNDSVNYNTKKCNVGGCSFIGNSVSVSNEYKILSVWFSSEVWEAKNMVDFLASYGKLIYKDSEDVERTIEIENPIKAAYYGKTVYLKVPVEVESAKELSIDFILRNKHYIYNLF